MARKVYTIKVEAGFLSLLLRELNAWGVDKSRYQVKGNVVTTKDTNVVDVATETFIDHGHLLEIISGGDVRPLMKKEE